MTNSPKTVTRPMSLLPCRWHCYHAVDTVTMPMTLLPYRWHFYHTDDTFTMPMTLLPCRWHFYHADDHGTMPLTLVPSRWHCYQADDTVTMPMTQTSHPVSARTARMIRLWVRYSAVDMTITTIIIIIITSGRTDRKIGLTAIENGNQFILGIVCILQGWCVRYSE